MLRPRTENEKGTELVKKRGACSRKLPRDRRGERPCPKFNNPFTRYIFEFN